MRHIYNLLLCSFSSEGFKWMLWPVYIVRSSILAPLERGVMNSPLTSKGYSSTPLGGCWHIYPLDTCTPGLKTRLL